MRKYDKAFVIATSCILKHSSLQNENEVSGVNIKVFLCVINFLEKALSWNVQKLPEKRNLLGWTFIVTRITLLPRSVSLRVKIVNFDTEHLVSISICRLAFLIQIALPGDENVNIRQSQTSNCRCQTSLQNSIQNCSIFYLPYKDWHKVSDLFGLWMWTLDQVCYCCPFQVWNRQGTQDILGNNFN